MTPITNRVWKRRMKKKKLKKKNGKDSKLEYYKLETFPSLFLEVRSWEDSESYCKVNLARHMPQNHLVVASQDTDIEVYIWDLYKQPSFPNDNEGNGDVGGLQFSTQLSCEEFREIPCIPVLSCRTQWRYFSLNNIVF